MTTALLVCCKQRLVELQRAESRFAEWTSFIGANNAMTGIGAADAMAQAANIAGTPYAVPSCSVHEPHDGGVRPGCLRLLSTTDRFHDAAEAHRQFMKANQVSCIVYVWHWQRAEGA